MAEFVNEPGTESRTSRPRIMSLLVATAALVLAVIVPAGAQSSTTTTTTTRVPTPTCPRGQQPAAGGGDVCVAKGSDLAVQLADAAQEIQSTKPIAGVTYGVWVKGKPVVTGALGEAQGQVPATRRDHFRTGNIGEAMMTTVLLELVDQGKISLDEPIAKWFPDLPEAAQVTVDMLARSTSGYQDFVTTPEFGTKYESNPFQFWTPDEVIAIAMQYPPLFAPGTSWGFSDTNFVLLGQVLQKAIGKPYGDLVTSLVIDKLGLKETNYTTSTAIPEPVLHAYSNERGKYEEATYWSPSWVTGGATLTTNLADMGTFAQALGKGTLLSKQSHQLQVGPQSVGLGPLTEQRYYGMGLGVSNGWILANPQADGYTGIVAYLPSEQTAIAVAATFANGGDISVHYAGIMFNRLGALVAPANAPNISTCPRGGC